MNGLKISFWNANGLCLHKLELLQFLKAHCIDVMLISETHFTEKHFFNLPGYTLYDTKHPSGNARGGSAILIRSRIKHYVHNNFCTDYIQATSICLDEYLKGLTLSAIYCPPRHKITEQQYQEFFQSLGQKFLVAGDFNAKHTYWGSRLISPKGRTLWNITNRLGLDVVSSGTPTYWPSDIRKIPDVIDFAVIKTLKRNQLTIESSLDLSSDHSPTIVSISYVPSTEVTPPDKLTSKRTNWLKYKQYLSSHISLNVLLKTEDQINNAVTKFSLLLSQAAAAATPTSPTGSSSHTQFKCAPKHIEELIKRKRQIRRDWQNHRSPNLKKQLTMITRCLQEQLRQKDQRDLQQFVESLAPTKSTNYSLWRAVKCLKRPVLSEPPIRLPNGNWARSDAEKGGAFAIHLKNVFTPNPSVNNSPLPQLHAQCNSHAPIIRVKMLADEIKTLNEKKAPGPDMVTPKMVKELPPIAISHLLHIFNAILRTSHFPHDWKLSQIKMIPKPGKDPSNVASYRPISLLSVLSKLFEKLLIKLILPQIIEKGVIPDHQFGFREKHGTIEQVHRIVNSIKDTFEKKQYCSAVFLDITQAFDKVWHEGLISKLQHFLPTKVHNLLKNYLTSRKFVVKHKSFISREFEILAGVPQGSVLGPLLYILYTADMPKNDRTLISTFADDTAIMCSHPNPDMATQYVQNHLNTLNDWLHRWKIKVNESKCCHLTFTLRRSTCPALQMNGQVIPACSDTKYLGMHLDRRLTWSKHIQSKITQIKIKKAELNWLISRESKLNLNYKVQLYKSIIKPIWTYGIELWGTASPSNVEKLQRVQSKILRQIVKAPWFIRNANIHRDLEMPTIVNEISKLTRKYTQRLVYHPNALARNLLIPHQPSRFQRNYSIPIE